MKDVSREFDAALDSVCYYCGRLLKSSFQQSCEECDRIEVQGPQDDPWYRYHQSLPGWKALADKERKEYEQWSDSLPCLHGVSMDQECPECLRVMEEQ